MSLPFDNTTLPVTSQRQIGNTPISCRLILASSISTQLTMPIYFQKEAVKHTSGVYTATDTEAHWLSSATFWLPSVSIYASMKFVSKNIK